MIAYRINESPEDKRLQMYRNMREEILRDDNRAKLESQKQKLEEITAKMALLEQTNKEKDDKLKQLGFEEQTRLRDAA